MTENAIAKQIVAAAFRIQTTQAYWNRFTMPYSPMNVLSVVFAR